ncbi:MAG TPA: PLP-dependent aminotransferase family protein [Egibacteraceae bacterium]|nr:PLP-dependent aminotransferase family protein [Egibacteraceae bacterium]
MAVLEIDARDFAARLGEWNGTDEILYKALADRVEALIRSGQLGPDTRLPAERQIAAGLAVSRGTVMAAYDELRGRGLVETRHGSGTVVLSSGSPVTGPREAHLTSALPHESVFRWDLAPSEEVIDLRGAYWVGSDDLPDEAFELAHSDLRRFRDGHGYHVLGIPELRSVVAQRITDSGLATTPEEVLITSGAQQAIALTLQLVIGPGDGVVVSDPTYPAAVETCVSQQGRLLTVGSTPVGMDLQQLAAVVERHHPRLIYTIPSVHNPTGSVMPILARQRLMEIAAKHNVVVVDDRSLAETQLSPRHRPPPLASFAEGDAAARVVTIGSASKTMWGGLRIGWARAPEALLARIARLKAIADLGTPVASQLIARHLLERGDEIAELRRGRIAQHLDVLSTALTERIPEWTWTPPQGGLCLWVRLPQGDASDFAHIAARHGVGIIAGSVCSPTGRFRDHIRVPFGQPPEVLIEAADRLAAAWQEYRQRLGSCRSDSLSVVV